jgi:hypothetical protein
MAKYNKRRVLLKKGKQSRELKLDHGHVFEYNEKGSFFGYPLYDEAKELAKFEELLAKHLEAGFRIVEDSGLSIARTKEPKKPAGMDNGTWEWVRETDEILSQWGAGGYDNDKDFILDSRNMLCKVPEGQLKRARELMKILVKVIKELKEEAEEDPDMADYAEGLLDEPKITKAPPRKKKPGKKKRA